MIVTTAFSLPSAVFGAALGSAVLVVATLLLGRVAGAPPGLRLLGLAFLCHMGRYLALLALPAGPLVWILSEWAHAGFIALLPAGALAMVHTRPNPRLVIAGWGLMALYVLLSLIFMDEPAARALPLYGAAGAVMIASAGLFWRQARKLPGQGYGLMAIVLALWGLHKWTYPWVLGHNDWMTAGFLVAELLANALSIAVIVMAERHHRRFADRTRADLRQHVSRAEASEGQLQALLTTLNDGVVTVDQDGLIRTINPAAARMLGRLPADLIGQPAALALPNSDDASETGGLIAALAHQKLPQECQTVRPDGTSVALELSVSLVETGSDLLQVALLRDISGRKLSESVDGLVQEVNQRVLQGEGVEELMPGLCRKVLSLFGAGMVWVGAREADGGIALQGIAGPPVLDRYLRGLILRWDDGPASRGPSGRAMRLGITQHITPDNPDWHEILGPLAQAGLSAGVVIPLRAGQIVMGALAVYSIRPLDSLRLTKLEELASRIGIAVQVMHDHRRMRLQGAAIGAAANAMLITDQQGRIEWVNDAFTRLSGYSLEESMGHTPRLLRSGAQTNAFYHELWSTIQAGSVWRGELVERRKDGSLYTVEQTVTPMRDGEGHISHFVVVHEDITERRRAEERIKYLSDYDALTGLPNRTLFRQRLSQAITRADVIHAPLAVLFLDLEHFSHINDTLGHDLGDRLLGKIVERLSAVTRAVDTLARIGGDEFAVVLTEGASTDAAAVLARRLLGAVTRPYDIDGHEIHIGASVGIAIHPEDGQDADQLIKNADVAMYQAIREAPNGYRFFSNAMNEELRARVTLERDFRRALIREEFLLHYQPQLDILTGRVVGLEALVRWRHPENGLISPGRFIPLAEETGLISPLGDMVLRMACRQIHDWQQQDVPVVPVAVNLAAGQLRRPGLVEDILSVIQESGIETHLLELELTESGVMEDAGAAEHTLRELNAHGIKLAIDDFGTGYSSLSYLKRFPVAKLKIDQSFVRPLGTDEDDGAIARAVITLGHALGMTVVSEGVENQAQLSYLRSHGCDVMQGFLFSRPLPAAEIPAVLRARNAPPLG